jgi:hypothetical protein
MLHAIGHTAMAQVQSLLRGFLREGACPFSAILTVQDIVDRISQTCVEICDRIFTPMVTLCTFVSQIHSDDPSCRAAVARLNATHVAQDLELGPPLKGAPAACRVTAIWPDAPERTATPAACAPGLALARPCGQNRGWLGVSMPDTEANQQAYPQPGSQKNIIAITFSDHSTKVRRDSRDINCCTATLYALYVYTS